jgi:AraC-like DNA-binding protein
VTAISSPSLHYLGCELVADKSNEIPAARKLIARLDLDGKLISLDAPAQLPTDRASDRARRRSRLCVEHQRQLPRHQRARRGEIARSRLPPFAPEKHPGRTTEHCREEKKRQYVTRKLVCAPTTGEEPIFPCAAQIARLHRQRTDSKPEIVCLVTSRPSGELSPEQWLEANIDHWGIETGLHARLDASRHDDHCRLRNAKPLRLHSMFTRVSPSTLHRFFRAQTGMAPGAYFRKIKAEEARRLIHEEGWQVKAAAYHLGYRHPNDLSRALAGC